MLLRFNNKLISATPDVLCKYSISDKQCFFISGGKRTTFSELTNIPHDSVVDVIFRLYGGGKRPGMRQTGQTKRELAFKKEGESDYALVTKILGNKRVETVCYSDGKIRQCKIAGSCNGWIIKDDTVLMSFRSFDDKSGDIIHKYTQDETRVLTRGGYIVSRETNNDDKHKITFIDAKMMTPSEDNVNDIQQQTNNYEMPSSGSDSGSDSDSSSPNIHPNCSTSEYNARKDSHSHIDDIDMI